jgi:signal transduction histidine kinase
MKPVIPNELLKKVIAQLEPLLNKKAGIIEWDLEEANSSILADEENLYLSFFNIINNAIKYSLQPKIIISTVKPFDKVNLLHALFGVKWIFQNGIFRVNK